jgi:D-alanyl-D-alanine carboxypeptidase (penicillin-binding protein 5/6)
MARRVPLAVRASLVAACVALLTAAFAAAAADAAPALTPAVPAARPVQAQSPPPKAFIIVDVATGTILASDHPHDARPPASTAKVMTALTAVERLAPDAAVAVSPLAAAQPASRIAMEVGQQWPLPDALASLLLASANDSAYAIAETAGGSLDGFADAARQTAERLGMEDSTFADPAGLDDDTSFNGGTSMSAYDIAIATRNALAVPELARWAATRSHEFVDPAGRHRSLTNHNRLLPGGTRAYAFATGFKTGYTERAGHTLTATATKDGRSLIVVVLDTYDTYGWAVQLFELGFAIPNDRGTGEELPPVRVSPYAERVAAQGAFLDVTRGAAPATTTTPEPAVSTTEPDAPSTALDGDAIATQQPTDEAPADDGGGPSWFLVAVIVVLVLALGIVLRRRQVRRQRARRIARQRQRAAKMRSGGLTVVDPSDANHDDTSGSHVRIRRIEDE